MQKLSLAFLAVAFASPITLAAQLATPAYDSTYFAGLEWRKMTSASPPTPSSAISPIST